MRYPCLGGGVCFGYWKCILNAGQKTFLSGKPGKTGKSFGSEKY